MNCLRGEIVLPAGRVNRNLMHNEIILTSRVKNAELILHYGSRSIAFFSRVAMAFSWQQGIA